MKAMAEKNKHPRYHLKLLEPMQQSNLKYKTYIGNVSVRRCAKPRIMLYANQEDCTIYNDIPY